MKAEEASAEAAEEAAEAAAEAAEAAAEAEGSDSAEYYEDSDLEDEETAQCMQCGMWSSTEFIFCDNCGC